ncbi:MAG TPA: hypothetical protein GX400_19345 [Chloroflexi bacterium]|nr:hypothetical protein [Chloroflexota bacterium]
MSNTRARVLAIFGLLAGGTLLGYVLGALSPYRAGGQLDPLVVSMLLSAVFVTFSSVGTLLALSLHQRWPALAGRKSRQHRRTPSAAPALRQGVLAGLTLVTLLVLAILRVLDVAVFIVTLLVAGLIEAFVQSRQ